MLRKLKNRLLNVLRSSPAYQPVNEFISPCQTLKMTFSDGWEQEIPKRGETTFVFLNSAVEGILYASVLSSKDKNYKYHPNKSLEMYKGKSPELLNISKYKAVLYVSEEEGSNVFYRHYDIGHNQTLVQFTWMTPIPHDELTNQNVESLFETIEIK